mmetsp:Transcript_88822/g.206709  ORF Transcript_88822/g.206709 Transcript_88822/m.206709 type:complete len:522 (-) Transcript_88822:188-1753(-)
MGAYISHMELKQAIHRCEQRIGQIPVEGRYHRLPRRLSDDYDLSSESLGAGYNGAVLLATNRRTGAKCAVKSFKLSNIGEEHRRDLVSEVEIFLGMDHPHVARLMEVYESASSLSLVMELLGGGELWDRLHMKTRFAEVEAAGATRQMLLALNYLHSGGIAHCDLKLENWLYDYDGSSFLKLIDFGFSRYWGRMGKPASRGTLPYIAPEVLSKHYTSQCDIWSLGVMVFILLCGDMPFHGSTKKQTIDSILCGRYVMHERHWSGISPLARHFVQSLLVVWPEERPTAAEVQQHPWLSQCNGIALGTADNLYPSIADAFCNFAHMPRFRRACLQLMAWSLSREDRSKVEAAFLELDKSQTGVIRLPELKHVLREKLNMLEEDYRKVMEAFGTLAVNSGGKIQYSDFLAAVLCPCIGLHEGLVQETFRRFDTDECGLATLRNLQKVLGRPAGVDEVFDELDTDHDGRISAGDFVKYLCNTKLTEEVPRSCGRSASSRFAGSFSRSLACMKVPFLRRMFLLAKS